MKKNQLTVTQALTIKNDRDPVLRGLEVLVFKLSLAKKALTMSYYSMKLRISRGVNRMIGSIEKGIKSAEISSPPIGVYEGIDLRILPKYICFKAALIKEKVLLQYILIILAVGFVSYFLISRNEINNLYTQLRQKEYILAPGVVDFTSASPQSVSDNYVDNAAMSFLSLLGNINAVNIDSNYLRLANFMADELRIRFSAEVYEWKETVKLENISEILKVREKEIISNGTGFYRLTAIANRDRYVDNEFLGTTNEVIEMTLKLVPPQQGKEWFLQINSLNRSKAGSFKGRNMKITSNPQKGNSND